MKTIAIVILFVLCASSSYSQLASSDTVRYTDSSRVTTTYSQIFIGRAGIWKYVDISIDTTSSSTQTVIFVVGAAADTNNPAKKIVLRLPYNRVYNHYETVEDTLRMKTLGGTVPSLVISKRIPPVLTR